MTTRRIAPILPIEIRKQLWDRLWREVLFRPHIKATNGQTSSGQEVPAGHTCPCDTGRVTGR